MVFDHLRTHGQTGIRSEGENMGLKIYQVDSFTDKPFAGNPAGVCILPGVRNEKWMQNVAREINAAETAFLVRQPDGYDLRWFTPAIEVDLCGHATLAAAHILWETGQLPANQTACFHTRSGLLTAERKQPLIELNFPATPAAPADAPEGLLHALGVKLNFAGKSPYDYLVEVDSEQTLRKMEPDFGLIRKLGGRGVIVTSRSDSKEFDFISRFFAPAAGIDEDPVTGSAHCTLGPYWAKILGKNEMTAFQASSRGGVVKMRLSGDRVHLGGQAVTVLAGELVND
jgi:PhzF family phenazine biosynthesis protein